MTAFNQMGQFMHDDVFCTYQRFLCEFKIQPDPAHFAIASTPSGFHLFDADFGRLDTPPPMAPGILSHFLRGAAVKSQFSLLVVYVDLLLGSLDFGRWIAEVEFGEREFIWRWFICPVVLSH